jgi:hypothetical protein
MYVYYSLQEELEKAEKRLADAEALQVQILVLTASEMISYYLVLFSKPDSFELLVYHKVLDQGYA